MPYWELFYHINWATKYRAPVITRAMEGIIYAAIREKSEELGCPILATNGVADHIHVAVRIAPSVAVATWVQQAKGASAYAINRSKSPDVDSFRWQEGYGVLSFGLQATQLVVDYIEGQKEHHKTGHLYKDMERTEP